MGFLKRLVRPRGKLNTTTTSNPEHFYHLDPIKPLRYDNLCAMPFPSPSPHTRPTGTNSLQNFPGDHRREQYLNKGSEADVELWRHKNSGDVFVAKSIRAKPLPDVKGLPNEVHILKDLPRHTNIIKYLAFYPGTGKGRLGFILFEYLPGGDMFTLRGLQAQQSFTEAFMWATYSQLSSALAFLHHGIGAPPGFNTDYWTTIVHRDIKLENVFILSLGNKPDMSSITIKLGDFGLAAFYTGEEDADMPCNLGTPEFWPPEITYECRKYGPEADIWAIGAVMHELAHQFPPICDVDALYEALMESQQDTLPRQWLAMSVRYRKCCITAKAARRALPINLKEEMQTEDHRRCRPCPKYSDGLNECMMMALEMDKGKRAKAARLNKAIEEKHGAFAFEEMRVEFEQLRNEEECRGSDSES